jgi:hypothetical protein
MFTKLSVAAFVTTVLAFGSTGAIASPFFSAESRSSIGGILGPAEVNSSTDGSTVTSHTEMLGGNRNAIADAVAGRGFLGVSSNSSQVGLSGVSEARSGAEFTVSLFTTCPAGAAACATSPTSINFSMGGHFSGGVPVGMNAEGALSVGVRLKQVGGSTILSQNGAIVVTTVPEGGFPQAGLVLRPDLPPDGLLAGYILNQNLISFTTAEFSLAPDSEYELLVFMNSFSQSPIRGVFTELSASSLDVDFGSTLTFGPGPVFNGNLPFQISAPDANIANNQWIDPRGVSGSIPEPEVAVLFAVGLTLMGWMRRRGKGRAVA